MNTPVTGKATEQGQVRAADQPVLDELQERLLQRLPGLVRRIVLYGSRARGDFRESSDLDVLVVLKDCTPATIEQARAARYEVMERRGFEPLVSLLLLGEREWQDLANHSAGLKHNVEHEGRIIWSTT